MDSVDTVELDGLEAVEIFKTREEWLNKAVELITPIFLANKYTMPIVRASCGWPSKGGTSTKRVLGECWHSVCTRDGSRQIFISPVLESPIDVLGTLAHEMLHAVLPDNTPHSSGEFKDGMKKIGLEGPAKSALPDPHLTGMLSKFLPELGIYPNVALELVEKEKKTGPKSTFKYVCPFREKADNKCLCLDKNIGKPYAITLGKANVAIHMDLETSPTCVCGFDMEMKPEDFEAWSKQFGTGISRPLTNDSEQFDSELGE